MIGEPPMMTIGTVQAGNTAQREYHVRQLAHGQDDYGRGEGPPGVWVGGGAQALGLTGEATVEQLEALFDGQRPQTGASLFQHQDTRKTVAFDVALSAPKSVSLIRAAGDPKVREAIEVAHTDAVEAATRWVDQHALLGRSGKGGGTVEPVPGMIAIRYRHELSRAEDPNLHAHLLVMNIALRARNGAGSLNSPVLYRHAKAAGAVYQAVLRHGIHERLGLEFRSPVDGLAELRAIDPDLIETFSSRSVQIKQALETLNAQRAAEGLAPVRATDRGALDALRVSTRERKDDTRDHDAKVQALRARIADAGLDHEQVAALVAQAQEHLRHPVPLSTLVQRTDLDALTVRETTFGRRELTLAVAGHARGLAPSEVDTIEGLALADARVLAVASDRWSTQQLVAVERAVIGHTTGRGPDTTAVVLPAADADGHLDQGRDLSTEQRQVARDILTSGRGVEAIVARAGAGKTYMAGALSDALTAAGYEVAGVAPTHRARNELASSTGLEVKTVHAATARSGLAERLHERSVVLVDEAGAIDTRTIAPLLAAADRAGAKVLAIGDDRQLSAVAASGWFRDLVGRAGETAHRLDEVRRQHDPVERAHLNALRDGDPVGQLGWMLRHDRLHLPDTVPEAQGLVATRWGQAVNEHGVDQVALIAMTNRDRRLLNDQARRVLQQHGTLDPDKDVRIGDQLVAPGDRLIAGANVRELHLRGGQKVEHVGWTRGLMRLRDVDTGTVSTVAPSAVARDTVSRQDFYNGDRLRVGRVLPGGEVQCHNDRGETIMLSARDLTRGRGAQGEAAVEHAYAITGHKAQGATVQQAIVYAQGTGHLTRNWSYVALSRARERTDLILTTNGQDRILVLEQLQATMVQRADERTALAQIRQDEETEPAPSVAELERQRSAVLLELPESIGTAQAAKATAEELTLAAGISGRQLARLRAADADLARLQGNHDRNVQRIQGHRDALESSRFAYERRWHERSIKRYQPDADATGQALTAGQRRHDELVATIVRIPEELVKLRTALATRAGKAHADLAEQRRHLAHQFQRLERLHDALADASIDETAQARIDQLPEAKRPAARETAGAQERERLDRDVLQHVGGIDGPAQRWLAARQERQQQRAVSERQTGRDVAPERPDLGPDLGR